MKDTMRAFQFADISKGLELKDVPLPKPGVGQVLVRVKATGLCHTDCNTISGKDSRLILKHPITLGHEIAGIIVALGPEVTEFNIGERVLSLIAIDHPLAFQDVTTSAGFGYDGGYAEYVVLNVQKTLRIPDQVTFAQAAVATDAVATAYYAVVAQGQASSSSTIAIIGLGGLGLSAVSIASSTGAKVYGIDIDPRKYLAAIQCGALRCGKSLATFSGIQFDTVVDFAGAGITTASSVNAVKPGGIIVLVGLAAKEVTLSTYDFIARGVTLKGTIGASREEVEQVLELIAKKKIHPVLDEIPFADIAAGLERLNTGNVVGRLYADPSKD